MKKIIILIFCYNVVYSQNNLNDIVNYINENKLVDTINVKSLKKVKSSNSLVSLINYEENNNYIQNTNNYSWYKNDKYDVLEIKHNSLKYYFIINDFNNYKIFVSSSGHFILYDKKNKRSFYIEGKVSSKMTGYEYPDKILNIESIHYLDDNFNVKTSLFLSNNHSFCSSRYTFRNKEVIEEIYLDKPILIKENNITEMKLNYLLTFIDTPMTFNFYRKIILKHEKKQIIKNLFWFLKPKE